MTMGQEGGRVPTVDPSIAKRLFHAVHSAIRQGLVRSCHDLSEGGLAVALAEMAFAGGLGARVSLKNVPRDPSVKHDGILLFSESPSRFVLEVEAKNVTAVTELFREPFLDNKFHKTESGFLSRLGEVIGDEGATPRLIIEGIDGATVIDASVAELKTAWQRPLRW
jgi:phosphoribosylformylglycinamidine (FGAM) synthase-like enzyme